MRIHVAILIAVLATLVTTCERPAPQAPTSGCSCRKK
ncbi:uncharacterized protein SOCEGT47_045640 [Sorangium cellulosum]|uniref:Lipoprotein n=1 Tax=Sorangium cellulosum TaxID=56 RepID=A0A4P2Q4E0_SORCE|nr:uncharacterized protein SOCEGT47_045640 [Sorangium cellulosum]